MNLLDVVVLVGVVLAAIRGYRQGALSQVAAFAGFALGLVVAANVAPRLAGDITREPGAELALWTLGLFVVMVVIGQGLGLTIGARLRRNAHEIGAAPIDQGMGVAIGAAWVMLGVWLLAIPIASGPSPSVAQQVRESRIIGAVDDALPTAPDIFARVGGYLDRSGFPQVFDDLSAGAGTAAPVEPPSSDAVARAQSSGASGTVRVQSLGCGGISSGSGVVVAPGVVVTNAHVVAGGERVSIDDRGGEHDATVIGFRADLDVAVLAVPGTDAASIGWVDQPSQRGASGATLGYPGGQRELDVGPARVRARTEAVGRDIYGRGDARREILILTAEVRPGNSGGPFVTSDGLVGGVVFAAADDGSDVAYALTAEQVRPVVDASIGRDEPVSTGTCRF